MIAFALFIVLITIVYLYYKISYGYWKSKGIEQTPTSAPFGSMGGMFLGKMSHRDIVNYIYSLSSKRYIGLYVCTEPILMVRDPHVIKQITVKHFDHFVDHQLFDTDQQIWKKNLFSLKGETWKEMRNTLTPAFTGVKMRFMFNLIAESADRVTDFILSKSSKSALNIEAKDLCTRFTTDAIGTTNFGVTSNSLKDPNNEFYRVAQSTTDMGPFRQFLLLSYGAIPKIVNVFGLETLPTKPAKILEKIITSSIKLREEQGITRPDMIQILMEAKKTYLKYEEEKGTHENYITLGQSHIDNKNRKLKRLINNDDIVGQSIIFLFAGHETTATGNAFMLYEMVVNPTVQNKVWEEMQSIKTENRSKVTYEDIMKLKYMNNVVLETLRKWPPANTLERKCTKTFTIEPIEKDEKPLTINKGDVVWMPICSIHSDPKHYPNPEVFDPDRFNNEDYLVKQEQFLTFGIGPRSCIGYRYVTLQMKIFLYKILAKFELTVTEKTEIPIILGKHHININAQNGIWIGFKPRNIL